jgi:AraC-like DNA-binding protein
MSSDPVATAMAVLRPCGVCAGIGRLGSPVGLRDDGGGRVQFHLLLSGSLLVGDGRGPLHRLAPGQAVVGIGTPLVLMDRPGRRVVDLDQAMAGADPGWTVTLGGASLAAEIYCGGVELIPGAAPLLLQTLAGIHRVGPGTGVEDPALETLHRLLAAEARRGATSVLERLTEAWFAVVLRALLPRAGTLHGLTVADPAIAAALAAIRQRPLDPWTVAGLAAVAGLARSRFAERFTAAVGEPPLAHVARWRIQAGLAAEAAGGTRRDGAAAAGYADAAAYRRALRRWGIPAR